MDQGQEKSQRWEIASFVVSVIAASGIAFSGFSLYVAKKAFVDEHEWHRRHYTVELLKDFNSDVAPFKLTVLAAYPGLYDLKRVTALSVNDAEELYGAKSQKDQAKFELRAAVIAYLNYMEFVCTAYKTNVVDQKTVFDLFNGLFIRNYQFFKEFIKVTQTQMNDSGHYKPIEEVVEHWQTLKAGGKPFEPLPKTGDL